MTVDLFDQTLLFIVYTLTALLFGINITLLWKHLSPKRKAGKDAAKHAAKDKKKRLVTLCVLAGAAIILSIVTWWWVQAQFYDDVIPSGGIAWVLPVYASLGFLILGIKKWRRVLLSLGGIIVSLLLVGLVVNNYYHYFGTIAAVFGDTPASTTTATELSTLPTSSKSDISYEQFYQPLPGQPVTGTLSSLSIPSSVSTFSPREGRIYIPPVLHGNNLLHVPVIVLLAGYPGNPVHWEQAGLLAMMNDFAAKHKGLAPIVAVVDFTGANDVDTECVDSKLGTAETYLTKDVPAYLKKHFQVDTDPAQWTIGGYSAGGTCASLLAIRNPTIYHNFMNITGDAMPSLTTNAQTLATLFNGSTAEQDAHTPNLLLKVGNPQFKTMHGWYYYANSDKAAVIARIKDQAGIAKNAGMDVQLTGVDGHHGFLVWKQGFVSGLPWILHNLRFTTE